MLPKLSRVEAGVVQHWAQAVKQLRDYVRARVAHAETSAMLNPTPLVAAGRHLVSPAGLGTKRDILEHGPQSACRSPLYPKPLNPGATGWLRLVILIQTPVLLKNKKLGFRV